MCQRMKNRIEVLAENLIVNEVLEKTWTHLIVDFITKLPLVVGKDAILVVYNKLLKITHFVATTEETLAKGLAKLFRDNLWKLHSLQESIISNRGPQFVAELTRKLNKMLEIETRLLTVFHLQTDRQTEWMNCYGTLWILTFFFFLLSIFLDFMFLFF